MTFGLITNDVGTVSFEIVRREGNQAAYSVAAFIQKIGGSFRWDCIGPEFIFNILA